MATNDKKPPSHAPAGRDLDEELLGDAQTQKFSPEEEAALVAESNTHKAEANQLFSDRNYDAALNKYDEALTVCPNYLDYELAVLRSNIAACHLNLGDWKSAIAQATTALDCLDRAEREEKEKEKAEEEDEVVEAEIISPMAAKAGPPLPKEKDEQAEAARRKRYEDIERIRAKALLRRARGRSELNGWSNLEGAIEDYKKLAGITSLGPADKKLVQTKLRELPPRAKNAQEKETAEMWGKLKEMGNGLLKPFGLSTDSFKMDKDEKTGGYSMNFQGGGAGGGKKA
ncbi:hypothetical protein B0H63DRAFT_104770 [Podospora didyma]|uniref:Tetratricopeptide repeat protein 1 n=1 Tax=Podospora didyma TaxID=330526 RepID=A0AAE0NY73_9PEZI|nr:hypothetical protein B0H63DRAFT_104770 [Podospora didyma]